LTDEVTDGSSDLDAEILVGTQSLMAVVDIAKHRRGDVDGKDIVAVEKRLAGRKKKRNIQLTHQ
jgi:hypothetical protein